MLIINEFSDDIVHTEVHPLALGIGLRVVGSCPEMFYA